MEIAFTALKIVTAAGGIFGYVVYVIVLAPEVHDEFIYKDRNPLMGDLIKYLLYGMNFCLVICALCPWWKISATPMWAWASVCFCVVASIIQFLQLPSFCIKCWVIGLSTRAAYAGVVTYLTHLVLFTPNA